MSATEVYSSTEEPSSDDRSSINSVIYVETVNREALEAEGASGGSGSPGGRGSDLPDSCSDAPRTGDSSSDSETSLDERNQDTDSSSSSDGTQVWVNFCS